MRIVNPETGQEFYLSRIKDNNPPRHISRTKPVLLVIEKQQLDLFSNPRKSNYAYTLYQGEWFACRNHDIALCGTANCAILNLGRPFKARNSPVIDIEKHDKHVIVSTKQKSVKRDIVVIKKQEQHLHQ